MGRKDEEQEFKKIWLFFMYLFLPVMNSKTYILLSSFSV